MSWLSDHCSRRRRDEGGAVMVLAAVGVVLAMISASLAVDLGAIAHDARQNQKVADLAALDAVRVLPADPTDAAQKSADRNKFTCPYGAYGAGCGLLVETGVIAAGVFVPAPVALATAVQVTARSPHTNAFPFTASGKSVERPGTATRGNGHGCFYPSICERTPGSTELLVTPIGTVRVGSTLASVSGPQATIFNRLLTNTVGGSYTLSAAGWQGIAAGNVSFSRLRAAMGLTAGSPDTVLDTPISFRDLLNASVTALNADGSPSSVAAATPLTTIKSSVAAAAGAQFTLRRLFNIVGNVGGGQDVADATINVMDIVRTGMVLADTDHFAQFDLLASSNDLPLLQAALPNFVSAKVKFGLIEAPQERSGPPKDSSGNYRTVATTSQVRLEVVVAMNVSVVGIGLVLINVPYYFAAGSAQAKLDTMTCAAGNDTPSNVSIRTTTQPATVTIGTVGSNLGNSAAPSPGFATLTDVNLGITHVRVDTTALATTTLSAADVLLNFTPPYSATTSKPVAGTQVTSAPTLLAGQLNSVVTVAGRVNVGLQISVTTAVVNAVIGAALPLVNNLYTPLAKGLGLSIGGADVWAPPAQHCNPTSFNTDPTSSVGPDNPFGYQVPSLVK